MAAISNSSYGTMAGAGAPDLLEASATPIHFDEQNLRSVKDLRKLEGTRVTIQLGDKEFTDLKELRWQILHKAVYHHNRVKKTDWTWAREHLGLDPGETKGTISWDQLEEALNALPRIDHISRLSAVPMELITSFAPSSKAAFVSRQFNTHKKRKEEAFLEALRSLPEDVAVELTGHTKEELKNEANKKKILEAFWKDPKLSPLTNSELDTELPNIARNRNLFRFYIKLPPLVQKALTPTFSPKNSYAKNLAMAHEALKGHDFSSIKELDLSNWILASLNERLSSIPPGFLEHFTNLQVLSLHRNKLTSLEGLPESLPTLIELDLGYNNLTSLNGFPTALPKLKELDLGYNNLTSLKGLPCTLPQLKVLELTNAKLTSLEGFPTTLPQLVTLALGRNNLTSPRGLPCTLPQLTWLTLVRNRLTTLKGFPTTLPKLKGLRLFDNNLTSLEGLPESLPMFEEIDLRNNRGISLAEAFGFLQERYLSVALIVR